MIATVLERAGQLPDRPLQRGDARPPFRAAVLIFVAVVDQMERGVNLLYRRELGLSCGFQGWWWIR